MQGIWGVMSRAKRHGCICMSKYDLHLLSPCLRKRQQMCFQKAFSYSVAVNDWLARLGPMRPFYDMSQQKRVLFRDQQKLLHFNIVDCFGAVLSHCRRLSLIDAKQGSVWLPWLQGIVRGSAAVTYQRQFSRGKPKGASGADDWLGNSALYPPLTLSLAAGHRTCTA